MFAEPQPRFTQGLSVGATVDPCVADLGRLYQRAARRLAAKELRGFLLHQAEWLLHLHDSEPATRAEYVTQTGEYLRQLLALTQKPRHRGRAVPFHPEVVDD